MIPKKYKWLTDMTHLPNMVTFALEYYGTREVKGKGSNPDIMAMAEYIGLPKNIFPDDDTAWCAVFMAYIAKKSGKPMGFTGYELLRAASWLKWGEEVKEPMLGDVLVFTRPGGNHVGLYVAESNTTYFVLGGNQSDQVNIMELKKTRLTQARRFYEIGAPKTVKKYFISSTGKVSINES